MNPDQPAPPIAQHIGDGNDPGRPLADLIDSGMLWLVNTSVFHPRGLALALHVDVATGEATGWHLEASAPGQVYRYAVPAELPDPTKAPDLDAAFRAAERTIRAARSPEDPR